MEPRYCRIFSLVVRIAILAIVLSTPVIAGSLSFVGSLNPTDPNDVLLIGFSIAGPANVAMQSYGFGGSAKAPGGSNANGAVIPSGGFDAYFSLFDGTGSGATFLVSNDDGSCPPGDDSVACRDSGLLQSLAAGNYTLALSAFSNFSFAENLGTGTLGDGFIGLGSYFNLDSFSDRTSDYAVDITADGLTLIDVQHAIPEPASIVLLGTGLLGLAVLGRIKRRT